MPRFALMLLGDRLVAASVQGKRLETFTIDAEQLATTLRAELDQRGSVGRAVALGLPRTAVTVKPIELPEVDGELREMVQFELERHLPFPSDDVSFDFSVLPAESEGTATGTRARRVLVVAAERRVVEGALRLVEDARLRPISLTVAAHDLLALVPTRQRGHAVWVHRVGANTSLVFLAAGHIVLSRSVPTSEDEAIAAEIQRSLAVTRWRGVDDVWYSGDGEPPGSGTASGPAMVGVRVTEPPYTPRARALLAQVSEPQPGAAQLTLAVALAASRRGHLHQLLPVALRPRRLTRQQLMTVGALAAAVILGITALLVPGYRENRRLVALNKRIAGLDGEVRVVEQTLQELERKRRLLTTIRSLESNAMRPLPVLRELTELIPGDAWLTAISLDAKGVELTGQAAAANALIPVLENSARLERVEFASPVTRGRDKEQFRIRSSWEDASAPAAVSPPSPRDGQRPGTAGLGPGPAPASAPFSPPRRQPDGPPPVRQ